MSALPKERVFWKTVAFCAGILAVGSIAATTLSQYNVPPRVNALLVGCLASIAVGYTIVSRRSSPVKLTREQERSVRRPAVVGLLGLSVLLSLLFLIREFRAEPFAFFLLPFVVLGPYLIVRERVVERAWAKR